NRARADRRAGARQRRHAADGHPFGSGGRDRRPPLAARRRRAARGLSAERETTMSAERELPLSAERESPISAALQGWLWRAQLRLQPGRFAAPAISSAIGVALALAFHLVSRSALDEFDAALATVNGDAQARVESRTGSLDEALW